MKQGKVEEEVERERDNKRNKTKCDVPKSMEPVVTACLASNGKKPQRRE